MKNNIKLLIVEDNEEIIDLIKLYKPDNFYILYMDNLILFFV